MIILILFIVLSSFRCHYFDEDNIKFNITVDEIFPWDNPSETYRYYSLPFCQPEYVYEESQTLGENLSGDRKMNSLYEVEYKVNVSERVVCTKRFNQEEIKQFINVIELNYNAEFNIDEIDIYDGIGITNAEGTAYFLKNKIFFHLYYDEERRLLLFANVSEALPSDFVLLMDNDEQEIEFSYSLNFHAVSLSDQASLYNKDYTEEIHWFAITNSFFLVLLLTIFVGFILARIIKNEVSMVNDLEKESNIAWKVIRSELFIPPSYTIILSSFLGTGIQFLLLSINLIIFGILGLYYGHKGSIKTLAIFFYSFTGVFNGFFAAKYYKYMGGKHWAFNLLISAGLFPVILFIVWAFLNSLAWGYGSTAALPFTTVLFIIILCLLVYLPLTVIGGLTGRMRSKDIVPYVEQKFSKIPKEIPKILWYKSIYMHIFLSGLLPFSSLYLELSYIFDSVWGHKLYHFYGVLFLAFLLSLIVVGCVAVVFCYFTLNNQDYKWWWKSFVFGGSPAVFMLAYAVYFYYSQSNMFGFIQFSFFFGYSSVFCFLAFMIFGTVGFISAKYFVTYVFDQSKID